MCQKEEGLPLSQSPSSSSSSPPSSSTTSTSLSSIPNPLNLFLSFAQRPRILYLFLFTYFSCAGGRFSSLLFTTFWEPTSPMSKLTNFFAFYYVSFSILTPAVLSLSDHYKVKGTVLISCCLLLSLFSFISHFYVAALYDGDLSQGYYLHVFLRAVYAGCIGPTMGKIDGFTLQFLSNEMPGATRSSSHSQFGRERLWGAVGWAIMNVILGISIDHYGYYSMLVWSVVTCLLTLCSLFFVGKAMNDAVPSAGNGKATAYAAHSEQIEMAGIVPNNVPQSIKEEEKDEDAVDLNRTFYAPIIVIVKSCLSTPYSCVFLLCCLILSMGMSLVENLSFTFFKDVLGASSTLDGLTVVVTVMFEIPLFYYAPQLLAKLGAAKCQGLAMLAYFSRVLGYTLVTNPVFILFIEPLHGVTYAMSKTATVDFTSDHTPTGYESTGQGLMGALQGGVGNLLAMIFSGLLTEAYGQIMLYRFAAALVLTVFVLFMVVAVIEPEKNRGNKQEELVVIESANRNHAAAAERSLASSHDGIRV